MKHPQPDKSTPEQPAEGHDSSLPLIDTIVLIACVAIALLIVYMLLFPSPSASPKTEPSPNPASTRPPSTSAPTAVLPSSPQNAALAPGAHRISFRQATYDALLLNKPTRNLRLHWGDENNRPFKSIEQLRKHLAEQGDSLIFAMNAGMYQKDHSPQGLYIEDYLEKASLERRDSGYGNFYLQPNGVFAFNEQEAVVLERQQFEADLRDWQYATQSGPMLVIDGAIHPIFQPQSQSTYVRNGVGLRKDGTLAFAISNQRVNLYTFAAFFRDTLGCHNALYLDGAISSLYFPRLQRFDLQNNLGPMIGISMPKEGKELYSGSYLFEEKTYDVYLYQKDSLPIRFFLRDSLGQAYGSFARLQSELAQRGDSLLFATNAGSFNSLLEPEGLLIDRGRREGFLNLDSTGKGNFYLRPNGIFTVSERGFDIFPSELLLDTNYHQQSLLFATQSGPLLLHKGQYHPAFNRSSTNLHLRNAVALINRQTIAFVISNDPVNFYELTTFIKQQLGSREALCLDSNSSAMYAPEIGRNELDARQRVGPMIGVFVPSRGGG
ncbi:MAG: phosphodiester glycosidase family protein [Bacteroidota bacterium]